MHIDGREVDEPTITSDVCVIGAGAAGITIARRLSATGRKTLLIESGGFERNPEADELGRATAKGIGGDYLAASRVRTVGGTTDHWGGYCLPLHAQAFERRPWVAKSGWPIDRAELDPFYAEACGTIGIDPWPPDPQLPPLEFRRFPDRFTTRLYQLKRGFDFGDAFGEELVGSDHVSLVTHATCTKLVTDANRIRAAKLQTFNGRVFEAQANLFVLACGGIENPRLLLASGGIGNDRDLVGRYYIDHPEMTVAETMLWPGWDLDLYTQRRWPDERVGFGAFFPTAALQAKEHLLMAGFQIARGRPQRWGAPETREIDRRVAAAAFNFDCKRGATCEPTALRASVFARCEQSPEAANRVALTDARDRFGVPIPELHWRVSVDDLRSVAETTRSLGRSINADGIGRMRPFDVTTPSRTAYGPSVKDAERERVHLDRTPVIMVWGHHMGTTRMADSPSDGVVDRNGRVHGVPNLFVAGSSVFPTGGAANPTLTIVALALRLAAHLERQTDVASL